MKLVLSLLLIISYAQCETAQQDMRPKDAEPKTTKQEAAVAGALVGATSALLTRSDDCVFIWWYLFWHGMLKPNNNSALYTYVTAELGGICATMMIMRCLAHRTPITT